MRSRWWWAAAMMLAACEPAEESERVAVWEPIDAAFAGCQGACGAHVEGPTDGVVTQPGAAIGQRTYCPVSGAVFAIEASHPHVDVGGQRLWFCCASCAEYFEGHRERVLRGRGIGLDDRQARVER